jgi:hypothetical protein
MLFGILVIEAKLFYANPVVKGGLGLESYKRVFRIKNLKEQQ